MTDHQPFVTVIMPIRNEAKYIERSLGAVLSQDYPHNQMEVLISDGMSDDSTRALIKAMADRSDIPVKIVDNPNRIVPTGFNLALRQAKGEIIARVDGHCQVDPNYVSTCIKSLEANDVAGVGGPIETIGPDKLSAVIAAAMSSPFGVGGSAFRTTKDSTMLVDTIAFPVYRREAMNAAGFLDEQLPCNEDDEYNYRLRSMGYKLLLSSETHSKYFSRSSITSLWTQYFRYGYYKVLVLQKHPFQMRPRQFAPFTLVVGLVITALLAHVAPFTWFLFAGLLSLYIVANLAASVVTALQSDPTYIVLLPFVFAILHFSYGIGFAMGLVNFYKGWNGKKALS